MRAMLILVALLIPIPSFAFSQSIVDYCFTTADPQRCLSTFLAEEQAYQRTQAERLAAFQREQARSQVEGLLLFGSGAAFINGMNQGFHQMQLPYVSTPMFAYSSK